LAFVLSDLYRESLPPGRHPAAVVAIELDPREVDVNVHPAKAEVRFADEKRVVSAVRRVLSTALRAQSAISDVPVPGASGISGFDPRWGEWAAARATSQSAFDVTSPRSVGSPGALPELAEGGVPYAAGAALPPLRFLAQYDGLFLLTEGPDGLYLVDQHAAHERVVYEELRARREEKKAVTQRLLFPVAIELSATQSSSVRAHLPFLEDLGFELSILSGHTVSLAGVPSALGPVEGKATLSEVVESLSEDGSSRDRLFLEDKMLQRLACHAVTVAGERMTAEQTCVLLSRLSQCKEPLTCPHGRPSILRLSKGDLLRHFRRT